MVLRDAHQIIVVWPNGQRETFGNVCVREVVTEVKDSGKTGDIHYYDVTLPLHKRETKEP